MPGIISRETLSAIFANGRTIIKGKIYGMKSFVLSFGNHSFFISFSLFEVMTQKKYSVFIADKLFGWPYS
ncbi:hypothetical protein M2132_000497 [Dysgonomonas sp. PH5-45]|nr:hypothetical protein [Dysgonomonas sp. PH5-45]MDH6386974.1 hypothetical protein [Dysgonomonas sp. PH5-37]